MIIQMISETSKLLHSYPLFSVADVAATQREETDERDGEIKKYWNRLTYEVTDSVGPQ